MMYNEDKMRKGSEPINVAVPAKSAHSNEATFGCEVRLAKHFRWLLVMFMVIIGAYWILGDHSAVGASSYGLSGTTKKLSDAILSLKETKRKTNLWIY